ncbi:DNA repair protein RadC [Dysgonomonas sp. PFB1-18]|uniref:RadC family protein n=1 Tax=unclassified Dysgonomonas TaxID=2630389 RepID=UPI002475225E|nr:MULTISPECIES: DNA repair protein RadC [unclassified Dysgonomonas]MDL2303527.1 DNA repair protein RadC [Dysgonomonas sp. OttesenSCG-928-D17]MDH6308196.1 DNA repair protein RadC [Dysgonomonas sp. PF1-14]MDH6338365.1 DNA repair protein RadC [Dysgonomonas sp. PF1-16]MDH6379862.1 DNA repair protein RadC [Dysgonomonas sp. PFB1-18]MDH6397048.1 DNA repair protein RadC [Dysgonomonas sp. PF1-23]
MQNKPKLNIKDWAEEDRPREKMLLKGVAALSDAELLGILIGSGNKNETAVELAQRILHSVSNNLNTLGKQEINTLIKNFNGIGEAKAITIAAAMELGKRRKLSEIAIQPQITSSEDAYQLLHPVLADIRHEEVWVLLLNRANRVLKKIQVSKGGISGTVVDIRMIMKEAIDNLASAIILCHNHPSGNSSPSTDDDNITKRLKEAGKIMEIQLLDHIIVCDHSYYSYLDKGRL